MNSAIHWASNSEQKASMSYWVAKPRQIAIVHSEHANNILYDMGAHIIVLGQAMLDYMKTFQVVSLNHSLNVRERSKKDSSKRAQYVPFLYH